jgi:hypothetical protein
MKICSVGAELFQAVGRTDLHTERQATKKQIIVFRNFVKVPKKTEVPRFMDF